ncbi:MAG: serine/threonine-protein kinase [Thermodesulfobacteriota bacterium]
MAKERDANSLRQELYSVLQNYAELASLARKGTVDPFTQIGQIVQKRLPFFLVLVGELLPKLERNELTYHEALYKIIRTCQKTEDQRVFLESKKELGELESKSRVFVYAFKWMDLKENSKPTSDDVQAMIRALQQMDKKYKETFAPEADDTTTLIPCFLPKDDSGTEQRSLTRMASLVQRAILELNHFMVEYSSDRSLIQSLSSLIFSKGSRSEMEADITRMGMFLFRCGYSVDEIARGYYKDSLSDFLNRKTLELLRKSADTVGSLAGLSNHLALLSLLDFANFFELPSDYRSLDDSKEALRHAKVIKAKNRRGGDLLRDVAELSRLYESKPTGRLVQGFLHYRYYASFGDYHGIHRVLDARAAEAVKIYKPRLDSAELDKKTRQELAEKGGCFSSKTQDEMAGIIALIQESLANPKRIKGQKVKVLGDISSGAMGEVSIGIFENRIVALKRVKAEAKDVMGDAESLLTYEANLHERVQTPEQHPYIVEYYGLVDQDGEKIMISAYHPNDNLTQLVERNWGAKPKAQFKVGSVLDLGTIEIITNQLLDCLKWFRQKGVVHRDLKTDNVLYMVDQNERLNLLKVIDFGVALAIGNNAVDDLFKGKIVGTFSYMAPEQARGKSGFQSDLYSVGAILTVLLTGTLPMVFPRTKTREELIKQIARVERAPRPKLVELNPWLARDTNLEHLAATVERMLDLDPVRRPDANEIQEAFDGLFQHIGPAKHTTYIFYTKEN